MSKFFSNLLSDLNLRSSKFDERKLYPPQVLYYTINELRLQVSVRVGDSRNIMMPISGNWPFVCSFLALKFIQDWKD